LSTNLRTGQCRHILTTAPDCTAEPGGGANENAGAAAEPTGGRFRGWAWLAIPVIGALITTTLLAVLVRRSASKLVWTLLALACFIAAQVVVWVFTYPANLVISILVGRRAEPAAPGDTVGRAGPEDRPERQDRLRHVEGTVGLAFLDLDGLAQGACGCVRQHVCLRPRFRKTPVPSTLRRYAGQQPDAFGEIAGCERLRQVHCVAAGQRPPPVFCRVVCAQQDGRRGLLPLRREVAYRS
jgi:hypothetical protein